MSDEPKPDEPKQGEQDQDQDQDQDQAKPDEPKLEPVNWRAVALTARDVEWYMVGVLAGLHAAAKVPGQTAIAGALVQPIAGACERALASTGIDAFAAHGTAGRNAAKKPGRIPRRAHDLAGRALSLLLGPDWQRRGTMTVTKVNTQQEGRGEADEQHNEGEDQGAATQESAGGGEAGQVPDQQGGAPCGATVQGADSES